MNADHVNPFIESVYELFHTMFASRVVRTGLNISNGERNPLEIMALIGFSGLVKGTVALALPKSTCQAMIDKLLGSTEDTNDATVSDTLAEMVNIVAGSAKAKLSLKIGTTLDLSLPVVFTGEQYHVYSPSQATWLEIPFSSELGELRVRLNLQEEAVTA